MFLNVQELQWKKLNQFALWYETKSLLTTLIRKEEMLYLIRLCKIELMDKAKTDHFLHVADAVNLLESPLWQEIEHNWFIFMFVSSVTEHLLIFV